MNSLSHLCSAVLKSNRGEEQLVALLDRGAGCCRHDSMQPSLQQQMMRPPREDLAQASTNDANQPPQLLLPTAKCHLPPLHCTALQRSSSG